MIPKLDTWLVLVLIGCTQEVPTEDCSICPGDQLCIFSTPLDDKGDLVDQYTCVDYPSACADDRSCACLDALMSTTPVCEENGWATNTDSCVEVEGRPEQYCEVNLG